MLKERINNIPKPKRFLIALALAAFAFCVVVWGVISWLNMEKAVVQSPQQRSEPIIDEKTGVIIGEPVTLDRPIETKFAEIDDLLKFWEEIPTAEQKKLRAQAYILFPDILSAHPNWQGVANWLQDEHRIDVRQVPRAFATINVQGLPPVYGTMLADIEAIGDYFRTLKSDYILKFWGGRPVSDSLFFRFEQWREKAEPYAVEVLGEKEARNFMINIMIGVRQPAPGDPLALQPL